MWHLPILFIFARKTMSHLLNLPEEIDRLMHEMEAEFNQPLTPVEAQRVAPESDFESPMDNSET
jgi:hypothetical protein